MIPAQQQIYSRMTENQNDQHAAISSQSADLKRAVHKKIPTMS